MARYRTSDTIFVECLVCLKKTTRAWSVWQELPGGAWELLGHVCKQGGCYGDYAEKHRLTHEPQPEKLP